MNSRIERLLIALMFALLASGVTLIFASAQGENSPAPQTSTDCVACHTEFQAAWEKGAHGQAEGVTCQSCHGPALPDHPKTSMPVNRSPDLCASCHSDSQFGWSAWKASTHNQSGLDCVSCHNPHSASLKQIAGPRGVASNIDAVSALCINCHKESNMNFALTSHAQRGVSCAQCHVDKAQMGIPNHSFSASLNSCNSCHSQQMHSPTGAKTPDGNILPATVEPAKEVKVTEGTPEPDPVSPMGFSAMAGFIGLAGGMVLAPWLERWYHRTVKQNREDENESENS